MPLTTRVIARLDVKAPLGVVKGRRMDGLRVIGQLGPVMLAAQEAGADEILYVDVVASLYGRGPDLDSLRQISDECFTPLTVAGGIRSVEDVRMVMRRGADKVAINTAALQRPVLLRECAEAYGSQAIVCSIEATRQGASWTAYTCGGREPSGRDAIDWAEEAVSLGAGELLITSVDRDGCGTGCDLALLEAIRLACPTTPLVASGGIGDPGDALDALYAGADAVAVASALYRPGGIPAIKELLATQGVLVRR